MTVENQRPLSFRNDDQVVRSNQSSENRMTLHPSRAIFRRISRRANVTGASEAYRNRMSFSPAARLNGCDHDDLPPASSLTCPTRALLTSTSIVWPAGPLASIVISAATASGA